jgi:hypothetical protein
MAPILGIYASQISGHLFSPSGAYDSIATTTVGAGGSSSVTFSSIPSGYTHLQVRVLGRSNRTGTTTDYLELTFNSDTGANYSLHQLLGDGSTASANSSTSQNYAIVSRISTADSSASMFGGIVLDILDYANTSKYKTTRSLGGTDQNGSGAIYLNSGLWMSASAITSVTVKPSSANSFVQYSSIALYGIRGGN